MAQTGIVKTARPQEEFTRATEPLRRELLAHCYRMLGSADEAEDAVQESLLRAWRAYGDFEGRSSVRTWLYRIATNTCLNMLQRQGTRRVLPSGLAAPAADPFTDIVPAGPEVRWLQPFPGPPDPADIVASRESLRLALIASLQHLPARQRAVLILREVMAFSATEVAEMLDMSTPAVKSLLQRARARLAEVAPAVDDELLEPTDPRARALLERYIAAFENSDVTILESALREDAALEMTGSPTWFAGLRTCLPFMATRPVIGVPGEWRMKPVEANGQPAVAVWRNGEPYGIAVLSITAGGISRIVLFAEPALLSA